MLSFPPSRIKPQIIDKYAKHVETCGAATVSERFGAVDVLSREKLGFSTLLDFKE